MTLRQVQIHTHTKFLVTKLHFAPSEKSMTISRSLVNEDEIAASVMSKIFSYLRKQMT
jgi:hypothetical protein